MITGKRKEHFVAELTSRGHTILADVPQQSGGTDLALDPHEIFEAALAACTIITVQMYAERKNWKLESADVRVSVDQEAAQSHLTREISFRGELDEQQIARLLEIADRCPIHKLMTGQISISTVLR